MVTWVVGDNPKKYTEKLMSNHDQQYKLKARSAAKPGNQIYSNLLPNVFNKYLEYALFIYEKKMVSDKYVGRYMVLK